MSLKLHFSATLEGNNDIMQKAWSAPQICLILSTLDTFVK